MGYKKIDIIEANESHWQGIWKILQPTFERGDTYAYPPGISEDEAKHYWLETPQKTFIAIDADEVVGVYYIKPNQPGLGSHICNIGYVVSSDKRGGGIGTQLAEHSFQIAKELGFYAIQANLVVSTNTKAIKLWQSMGFEIIGTIPNGFNLKGDKYVDAHIMFKVL